MNNVLELLLTAIPEKDYYSRLKRIEIMRWHQFCNIESLHEKSVECITSIFSDKTLWKGYKMNRALLEQKILNDFKNIIEDNDYYRFTCILCSKEKVREYFLDISEKLGCSIEDLVTDSSRNVKSTKLESFWSHYANIIDMENVSPAIIKSFSAKVESIGFRYNDHHDIMKYGLFCAREDSCLNAMIFFMSRLVKNEEEQYILTSLLETMRWNL